MTGNPVPWNGRGPGNNLWTDSIVALHVRHGQLAWGFQTVHHDIWDYDVTNPPILFDLTYNGQVTPAIGVASKTGWVYLLNRITGKPILGIPEKKVPQLKGAAAKYANTVEDAAVSGGRAVHEPVLDSQSSGLVRRRTASRTRSAASSRRTPT